MTAKDTALRKPRNLHLATGMNGISANTKVASTAATLQYHLPQQLSCLVLQRVRLQKPLLSRVVYDCVDNTPSNSMPVAACCFGNSHDQLHYLTSRSSHDRMHRHRPRNHPLKHCPTCSPHASSRPNEASLSSTPPSGCNLQQDAWSSTALCI